MPIVITGLGLACSLGVSPEEAFDSIVTGRNGLGVMAALEQRPTPDKGGGQARDLPGSEAAGTPREVQYLRHVVAQGLRSAGSHSYSPLRVACVLGTTLHGMRAGGRWLRSGDLAELRMFPAGAILRAALDGLGIDGARLSTCSACSSGLSAVFLGATLLRSGEADLVIAGGYDTVSEYVYAGFESLRLVAAGPPRPFGAGRDGMKVAEGYAVVVMERGPDARQRGATCRGYLAGYGESADAHHLTQPHPEGRGARAAIAQALEKAGVSTDAIELISAHATATPGNDASEYAALRGVFGTRLPKIPVVAFKSHLGHTLGGAGAVELVLSVLARERGVIPPTLNAAPVDESFVDLRLNHGPAKSAGVAATLTLSLGFGGANTCVVVASECPASRSGVADEAVITGVGVVLPGAVGNDRFKELLSAGGRGERCAAGPVHEESIAHLLNTRRVRRMSEYVKLTLAATNLARTHAVIDDPVAFAEGACVLLGTMHGSANFCEAYYSQIVREGLSSANPVLFAEGVPNAAAAQLSLMLGVRGGCQTIIGTRTAGLDAFRLAALRIREGAWSRAFVGAGEEHSETVNGATVACDPTIGAEFCSGAVTVIVESRRFAEARGARILATVDSSRSVSGGLPEIIRFAGTPAGGPPFIITSLGWGRGDVAIRHGLENSAGMAHWSLAGAVAESFSVGGLAALAAILLAPRAIPGFTGHPGALVPIIGTDFATGATGVRIRL